MIYDKILSHIVYCVIMIMNVCKFRGLTLVNVRIYAYDILKFSIVHYSMVYTYIV